MASFRKIIPSVRKIIPAALCAVAIAIATLPAYAHEFGGRGGWSTGGGGFHDGGRHHHGWGAGRALAFGGLGLATGALIADAYDAPPVYRRSYAYYGPTCAETVRTHYDDYGRLVKVVTRDPC